MDRSIIERLKGTVASDAEGRPLVLCHGTPFEFEEFAVTSDIGFHFGTEAQALNREQDKRREMKATRDGSWTWTVRKAALAVSKVLVYPDDPRSWVNWNSVVNLCRRADPGFLRILKDEGVNDPACAAARVRERLVELGYDAVAYRNLYESRAGSVSNWSWISLRPECVVDLPAGIDRIDAPVGKPIRLPGSAAEIPGAQNRSGSIRYRDHRMAMTAAFAARAAERGWSLERDGKGMASSEWKIEAGGLPGTAKVSEEIGRITFRLHPDLDEACAGTADDFVSFTGFERHPHSPPAMLTYQWIAGEEAADFVDRALGELDFVESLQAETVPFRP